MEGAEKVVNAKQAGGDLLSLGDGSTMALLEEQDLRCYHRFEGPVRALCLLCHALCLDGLPAARLGWAAGCGPCVALVMQAQAAGFLGGFDVVGGVGPGGGGVEGRRSTCLELRREGGGGQRREIIRRPLGGEGEKG